jgi:hypothetical protein
MAVERKAARWSEGAVELAVCRSELMDGVAAGVGG